MDTLPLKPWQHDCAFALNIHWVNGQRKILLRFAAVSSLVQSCPITLGVIQSILKAVKNIHWKRLNLFYVRC